MSNNNNIVIGNWKMNGSLAFAGVYIDTIIKESDLCSKTDIVVCPPFYMLSEFNNGFKDSLFKFGGQDCSHHDQGSYTGDISANMLKDVGCEFVIVGHYERRKNHFENNFSVSKKVSSAITSGLNAVICMGETLQEQSAKQTEEILEKQVKLCIPKDVDFAKIIIAYEPIWAIGSDQEVAIDVVSENISYIYKCLAATRGEECANQVRIIYGGSVNETNAKNILASNNNLRGFLVGRASLDANQFSQIIKAIN